MNKNYPNRGIQSEKSHLRAGKRMADYQRHPEFDDHEQVVIRHDLRSGLRAIIAVHNTSRGPALGGCRMYPYANDAERTRWLPCWLRFYNHAREHSSLGYCVPASRLPRGNNVLGNYS